MAELKVSKEVRFLRAYALLSLIDKQQCQFDEMVFGSFSMDITFDDAGNPTSARYMNLDEEGVTWQ